MTKKQRLVLSWFVGVLVVFSFIYLFYFLSQPKPPVVDAKGEIRGNYSIANILALGRPYVCNFEKKDETSRLVGTVQTDGQNIYADFRILANEIIGESFNSFLLVRSGRAYSWTSLAPVGYESKYTKSASKNASPAEQLQIVGLNDKMAYECKPLTEVDKTLFEVPLGIEFKKI